MYFDVVRCHRVCGFQLDKSWSVVLFSSSLSLFISFLVLSVVERGRLKSPANATESFISTFTSVSFGVSVVQMYNSVALIHPQCHAVITVFRTFHHLKQNSTC